MVFFVFHFIDAGVSDCKCSVVVRSFVLNTNDISTIDKFNEIITQFRSEKYPQTQQKLNGYIYTVYNCYCYIYPIPVYNSILV